MDFFKTLKGRFIAIILLIILLLCSMILSMRVGVVKLSYIDIIKVLFTHDNEVYYQIIYNIRLPRVILGLLVGASFAVSGTILQSLMRNPLASPSIIGISSGGGLAGIIVMLVLPAYSYLLVPAAFIGSLASATLVYLVAWKRGASPIRLILSGVAVSAMLGAFSSAILIFNAEKVGGVLDFSIGTLSTKSWEEIQHVFIYMAIGMVLAWLFSQKLNILALGDDIAISLGLRVELIRLILIAIASLLAASAVSVVGLLGFVGLISPHIMRLIIGSDNRFLIPASALFGGFLVVTCDTIGRMIMPPTELPVGIIMSVLGPPFFLYLLRRNRYEA